MSFSFSVIACSVALAFELSAAELDKVSEQQPIHARDRSAADATISNLLALVSEPAEGQELVLHVSGSCNGLADQPFQGVALSVSIHTRSKTG